MIHVCVKQEEGIDIEDSIITDMRWTKAVPTIALVELDNINEMMPILG